MERSIKRFALVLALSVGGVGIAQAQESGAVNNPQQPAAEPRCSGQIVNVDTNCDSPEPGTCATVQASNTRSVAANICVRQGDGTVNCEQIAAGATREIKMYMGQLSSTEVGQLQTGCFDDEEINEEVEPT